MPLPDLSGLSSNVDASFPDDVNDPSRKKHQQDHDVVHNTLRALPAELANAVPKWQPNTAYAAGQTVLNPDGELVKALAAFTSGATYDASKWSAPASTTFAPISVNTAQSFYGSLTKPWKPAVGIVELWTLANFQSGAGYNTTTLTPTVTANGTQQFVRTRIDLGNLRNHDTAFRLKFTIAATPPSGGGWWAISALLTDAGGTILPGTAEQFFANVGDPTPATGPVLFEFLPSAGVTGGVYLEVKLAVYNNLASGTLTINNVSLKEIPHVTRPMMYAAVTSYGKTLITQLYDPVVGLFKSVFTRFSTDGALTTGLTNIDAASNDQPFQFPIADPAFVKTGGSVTTPTQGNVIATSLRSMRINNNDQILESLGSDGTTWTLRGNVHGGEVNTRTAFEADADGSGLTWTPWDGTGGQLRTTGGRFRFIYDTTISRPAPDNDAFANVTHVATFFPNGVMRMDRTTTFSKNMTLRAVFDWLSSHDITVPKIGRIGRGLVVIDEVDTFVKTSPPATPTSTTAATGGTLSAGTYTYAVTALTEGGETTASGTVAQTTTGATSTNTVTWLTVSGATGYRIYGRVAGRLVALATVGPAVTSWVDDGTIAAFGPPAPLVNTARQYGTASISTDAAINGNAYWSVWFDPIARMCYAHIYDRDSVLSRNGVAVAKTRLEGAPGIQKSYLNVYWTDSDRSTVPNGTAWNVTHWSYVYIPQDPQNYHLEAALLASDLNALKLAYPAT